jgi:hypothetical protein
VSIKDPSSEQLYPWDLESSVLLATDTDNTSHPVGPKAPWLCLIGKGKVQSVEELMVVVVNVVVASHCCVNYLSRLQQGWLQVNILQMVATAVTARKRAPVYVD